MTDLERERIMNAQRLLDCSTHTAIEFLRLADKITQLEYEVRQLCDAIQWIVNRGPDKVPSEIMEKMKEWGT